MRTQDDRHGYHKREEFLSLVGYAEISHQAQHGMYGDYKARLRCQCKSRRLVTTLCDITSPALSHRWPDVVALHPPRGFK